MTKMLCCSRLAFIGAIATGQLGVGLVQAQTPSATLAISAQKKNFAIPAQSLSQGALRFSEQAGIQLVLAASVADGLHGNDVVGSYTIADALNRLLAGSGLSWRYLNARTITIERVVAPSPSGVQTFGTVSVEGTQTIDSNGFAELNGFGAGAGANGSSDVTATEGTGSFTTNGTSVASKVPQSLQQTAQTVTAFTQERIQQQDLTDLQSALAYTPGISLQYNNSAVVATFLSRGFEISTFKIDGGAPRQYNFGGLNTQATPDLSEYDHVEVLRGSDALYGGDGNPGGIINLERKRPLDHDQLTLNGQFGSWNNGRLEIDATGPVAFDGHLRARFDGVYQNNDYFYDVSHQRLVNLYGVIEGDLGTDTILRAGESYRRFNIQGYNQLGLPRYGNGDDLGLPRATCLCAPWNLFKDSHFEVFVQLDHRFSDDWQIKLGGTATSENSLTTTAILNGAITQDTKTGYLDVSRQDRALHQREYVADATLTGAMTILGLKQQLIISVDYTRNNEPVRNLQTFQQNAVDVFNFDPATLIPEPAQIADEITDIRYVNTVYGGNVSLIVQPMKQFHINAGFRYNNEVNYSYYNDYQASFQFPPIVTISKYYGTFTPAVSGTYDLTKWASIYAGYADISTSQIGEFTVDGKALPPARGVTYEAGLRARLLSGKLNASIALYSADQKGLGLFTNYVDGIFGIGGSCCFVASGVKKSKGVDLEIVGEVIPGLQVQASYNYNHNYVNDGETGGLAFQTQQPRHQFKLFTSYAFRGSLDGLTLSGGFRMETARSSSGYVCSLTTFDPSGYCKTGTFAEYSFVQPTYSVTDLRAAYRLAKHWEASLSMTNVTDTRYYATAGSSIAGNFYGEPRAFMAGLRAKY